MKTREANRNQSGVYVYEVRRIRKLRPMKKEPCTCGEQAAYFATRELRGLDREHLLAIYVDAEHMVSGLETVSIGVESASMASMTTIFRGALLAGARGIILAHNHPGGTTDASPEDVQLLMHARGAGELLGCPLLDFLIVGADDAYSDIVAIERKHPDAFE